jgi:hypothetical protein
LLLGRDPITVADDTFIDIWVQMTRSRIEH